MKQMHVSHLDNHLPMNKELLIDIQHYLVWLYLVRAWVYPTLFKWITKKKCKPIPPMITIIAMIIAALNICQQLTLI